MMKSEAVKKFFGGIGMPCKIIPFEECIVKKGYLLEKTGIRPKSAIILLAPYYTGEGEKRNISLYAVSRDYHCFFEEIFRIFGEFAAESGDKYSFCGFSDRSPIDEICAAYRAGLGVIGDNGLLINREYGSYVFIGEIFTDAVSDCYDTFAGGECLHCSACKRFCPSPEKCLSGLTQSKSEPAPETVGIMKSVNTAWGCDICQEVCPMNKNAKKTGLEFFCSSRLPLLSEEKINAMSDAEFSSRAYSWRGKSVIIRNLRLLGK